MPRHRHHSLLDSGRTRRPAPARFSGRIRPPRNPAGMEGMRNLPQAPRPCRTWPERRGGVCTPPRGGVARGAVPLRCTGIFRLRLRPVSCRIAPRHAHCIDAMRKERSVDLKSIATKASSDRDSGRLRSVSPRRCARTVEQEQVVALDSSFANDMRKRTCFRKIVVFDFFCGCGGTSEGFR